MADIGGAAGGAATGAKIGSIIPGVGSLAGGVLGGIAGFFGGNKQKKLEEEALRRYNKTLLESQLTPEDYISAYEELNPEDLQFYDPKLEQSIQLGDTAMAGITLDPAFKQAQMEALASLSRRGQEGLTLSEEAARDELVGAANVANKGAQGAIMQQAARQGRLNAGDTLAAQLSAAGGTYGRAAQEAADLAKQRDERAMQAILNSGQFASNLRSQEYGEKSDVAKARDIINQYNANLASGTQQRNVAAQTLAAQNKSNLQNQATIGNLGLRNLKADQLVKGKQAVQQDTRNIAKSQYGGSMNQAQYAGQQGENIGNMITKVGTGVGNLLGGVYGDKA